MKTLANFRPIRGYLGSVPEIAVGRTDYLAKGSRNWLMTGQGKLVGYKGPELIDGETGGTVMMNAAEGYASLGDAITEGVGSVFRALTALFFIGVGILKYNGASLNAVATSVLSLRLLENGTYAGTTLQAGLAQPSAPTIFTKSPGAGFTGQVLNQGTHSVDIWRVRSSTGAKSLASLPSNVVVTAAGMTIAITFPLPSSNGDDRWGIGTPKTGFPGPFYELREIDESKIVTVPLTDGAITATDATFTSTAAVFTADDVGRKIWVQGAGAAGADLETSIASFTDANTVELLVAAGTTVSGANTLYGAVVSGIARTVEFEWTDGALAGQPLAPTVDYFPPPSAVFGGTINDTMFLDGCYGDLQNPDSLGATIAMSLPLNFEAWPPDSLLYAPEPPTAVASRPSDGYCYRAGATTLGIISYTGGDPPLTYHLLWPSTGCLKPHNMVMAGGGRLYIWTGKQGWARINSNGEPEADFAIPFADDTEDFDPAKVVLGWDVDHQQVCAIHEKMILPYNEATELPGTPCDLTGKIRGSVISAVTVDNGLRLCANNVRIVGDAVTTDGTPTVTSADANFTADDVGVAVYLTDGGENSLTSTILSVDAENQITLEDSVTWDDANASLYIDTELRLYHFNSGDGTVSEAYTPFVASDDESDNIFRVLGNVTVDDNSDPVTLKIFKNRSRSNAQYSKSIYLPVDGEQPLPTKTPDVINAQSHSVYLRIPGHGGEVSLDTLITKGESSGIVLR